MRPSLTTIAVIAVTILAGCGPLPPQAPSGIAARIGSATGDISTLCGDAYQVQAFGGQHASQLSGLDAIATASAHNLAGVERIDPRWIYQGQTVAEIVHNSIAYLRACHLRRSADALTTLIAGR